MTAPGHVPASMRARNNGRYNGNGREWQTPPEVFDPLDREFGFTLDPCCTAASAITGGGYWSVGADFTCPKAPPC